MDKASDFGSEDCEFESRRGQKSFFPMREAAGRRIFELGPLVAEEREFESL